MDAQTNSEWNAWVDDRLEPVWKTVEELAEEVLLSEDKLWSDIQYKLIAPLLDRIAMQDSEIAALQTKVSLLEAVERGEVRALPLPQRPGVRARG